MPATNIEYVPGVCNIGPAEIRRRMQIGLYGLGATIVLFLFLYLLHLPALTRVILVVPAFMSATGFIQAYTRFCAGYGMEGTFNFTDKRENAQKTADPAAAAKDKKRAQQSLAYAVVIALVAAIILYFV